MSSYLCLHRHTILLQAPVQVWKHTTCGCMSWNRRVKFLTSSRNGKPLLWMKVSTNAEGSANQQRWKMHIRRVWGISPICWGVHVSWYDGTKDPWTEWSGWMLEADPGGICDQCFQMPTCLRSFGMKLCLQLATSETTDQQIQLMAWLPFKHGWRKHHLTS